MDRISKHLDAVLIIISLVGLMVYMNLRFNELGKGIVMIKAILVKENDFKDGIEKK